MTGYPDTPGWRHDSAPTSREAAEFVAPTAGRMMDRVEVYLRDYGPASPEEITAGIVQPGEHLLLTSIRARCTQLKRLGRAADAGTRGIGESRRCKVVRLRVTTADERSHFAALAALEAEKGEAHAG